MGITLSHNSALNALRVLRSLRVDFGRVTYAAIGTPAPWVGKRWSMREFENEDWKWQRPNAHNPLHVLVRNRGERVWMGGVKSHVCTCDLPAGSILWLDEFASACAPPLIFLQMAETMSLPALVMLGYELCGHFSRDATHPLEGPVTDSIPAVTSVEELRNYLENVRGITGISKAKRALCYVGDHAVSAPEALLATVYSLPTDELGYGMGPVTLNQQVMLDESGDERMRSRYPDLMFSFAPIGINYDGEEHLDLGGLVRAAQRVAMAEEDVLEEARLDLQNKVKQVRAKVVDDTARNRQLATRGRLVLPATKENLYGMGNLDDFTRDLLACAHELYGVDVKQYKMGLDDSELCRERYTLLSSMLPFGRSGSSQSIEL